MKISRRLFIRDGVATVTIGLAAPAFLADIAQAQGIPGRRLVVVYLGGGNDALSTLIPYNDPFYYSRRPNLAVPAANVLQVGTDASGVTLGLHPRLTGLKGIFDAGRAMTAPVSVEYENVRQESEFWCWAAVAANLYNSFLPRAEPFFPAGRSTLKLPSFAVAVCRKMSRLSQMTASPALKPGGAAPNFILSMTTT